MNFVEAELYNERLCDPDPEPFGPKPDPEWDALELDPDDDDDELVEEDSGEWLVSDFVTDQGPTADGYALLAGMDSRREFI